MKPYLPILFALGVLPWITHAQTRGILNQEAPPLEVGEWVNIPKDDIAPNITGLTNKVVYLYCFQSWCSGCHSSGFPTLQKVYQTFGNDKDVAFLAIQTTFEGFSHNTFDQAKKVAARYGLTMPVGQSGTPGKRSAVMQKYRTGGTPWTIIIDKHGIVRYNDFHIRPDHAAALIGRLKRGLGTGQHHDATGKETPPAPGDHEP